MESGVLEGDTQTGRGGAGQCRGGGGGGLQDRFGEHCCRELLLNVTKNKYIKIDFKCEIKSPTGDSTSRLTSESFRLNRII